MGGAGQGHAKQSLVGWPAEGYIFGAICPAKGKGAGLIMPWCDTEAMTEHLKETSAAVDPGAHAILMLDQSRWHGSATLAVPANITLLSLPLVPQS